MLSRLQVDINNIMHTITISILGICSLIMQERFSNWDSVNLSSHETAKFMSTQRLFSAKYLFGEASIA